LVKFTCSLHTLCVFRFPYFDHDAFMHHTMHVLDAPGLKHERLVERLINLMSVLTWSSYTPDCRIYRRLGKFNHLREFLWNS